MGVQHSVYQRGIHITALAASRFCDAASNDRFALRRTCSVAEHRAAVPTTTHFYYPHHLAWFAVEKGAALIRRGLFSTYRWLPLRPRHRRPALVRLLPALDAPWRALDIYICYTCFLCAHTSRAGSGVCRWHAESFSRFRTTCNNVFLTGWTYATAYAISCAQPRTIKRTHFALASRWFAPAGAPPAPLSRIVPAARATHHDQVLLCSDYLRRYQTPPGRHSAPHRAFSFRAPNATTGTVRASCHTAFFFSTACARIWLSYRYLIFWDSGTRDGPSPLGHRRLSLNKTADSYHNHHSRGCSYAAGRFIRHLGCAICSLPLFI